MDMRIPETLIGLAQRIPSGGLREQLINHIRQQEVRRLIARLYELNDDSGRPITPKRTRVQTTMFTGQSGEGQIPLYIISPKKATPPCISSSGFVSDDMIEFIEYCGSLLSIEGGQVQGIQLHMHAFLRGQPVEEQVGNISLMRIDNDGESFMRYGVGGTLQAIMLFANCTAREKTVSETGMQYNAIAVVMP